MKSFKSFKFLEVLASFCSLSIAFCFCFLWLCLFLFSVLVVCLVGWWVGGALGGWFIGRLVGWWLVDLKIIFLIWYMLSQDSLCGPDKPQTGEFSA